MAPRESVFTVLSPSLADITNAIEKIEKLVSAKILKKKLMYDMLLGFRALEQEVRQKQTDAYELITKWLRLFLKIQSNISIQDETLRGHFEKVVPSAVTYMIGCLQCKPKGIISYHYELLEMIHELLSNVRPEVLEKLASFETGIIACVWFPIDFVGDFNTQMMALRLLVMLLKCVDATRLESELGRIRCGNKSVLKDKMTAAIAVANFHAAKFENTARELLNTYNMHFAQHTLVYSFRCKTFKFGDNIEFYKLMNADNFWIDFNYSPRTLSFNGRCLTYNHSTYTNCSVSLQIEKLTMNKVNLSVKFQAPAKLVKNTNDFPDISSIRTAELILPKDEAKRLLENNFVLKYFNRNHRAVESNLNASVVHLHSTSITNNSKNNDDIECSISNNNNSLMNIIDMENKENLPPIEKPVTRANQSRCNIDRHINPGKFQKSYDFLIGHSNEVQAQVHSKTSRNTNIVKTNTKNYENANFKLPNLPKFEKQLMSDKLNTHQKQICSKIVEYSTSTSDSTPSPEKPKVVSSKKMCKNPRKQFFKTQGSISGAENNATNKKNKVTRKRNTRNKIPNTSNTAYKTCKKVNEVKPMLLSKKNLNPLEKSKNQPFNNITTNVQNKKNVITVDITESGNSNLVPDIYDNFAVSDAEPGQSYRNFKTRRSSNEQLENGPEFKRSRKSLPRAVKKDMPNTGRLESSTLTSRTIKPGTKRMSPDVICKDPFDALREISNTRSKARKIDATTTRARNLNLNSNAIEVKISANQDKQTKVAQKYTANKQVVPNIRKSNNLAITTTPTTRLNPSNINIEEVTVNKSHAIPAVSTEFTQIDDIEECRRDVSHNGISIFNDSNEFSDFPTFPNVMDMLSLNECESTKNRSNQITNTNLTNTDLNSPTKRTPNTDLPIKKSTGNILESHNNLIYYSRSESDSDNDEPITLNNTLQQQTTKSSEHIFLTPQIPLERCQKTTKSLTKCHVTTTGTSIITQQDRFVHHQQFLVNLTTSLNTPLNLSKSCTRATTKTTTKSVVKEKHDINLNSFMQRSSNIRALAPKALRQETSSMITNYTNNLNIQLDHINNDVSKNSTNSFIQKTCDIAQRMMNEIERERVSLFELETNVERLSRQLSWQYEAYQRKSQQFECYKQNTKTLFNALKNINLLEEIKNDTQKQLLQLQQTSESIATQQWRDFVNESTENLLRNISSLSTL